MRLYESGAGEKDEKLGGSAVVPGTVVNNCDLITQGKVLVRLPSLDLEVWARLSAPGGGSGAGLMYVPRADDEVLVALNQNSPDDAFVIGGLWSTQDSPPAKTTVDAQTKRVLKTGLKAGTGHELEFDDVKQSITILSTTKQKVEITPTKIQLENSAGTLSITLDNGSQTISIKGVNVSIEAVAKLTLKGATVEATADGPMTVKSSSLCSIGGTPVAIN